jgi:hypothetical protein
MDEVMIASLLSLKAAAMKHLEATLALCSAAAQLPVDPEDLLELEAAKELVELAITRVDMVLHEQ